MTTERQACGIGAFLPMSCRGRAEAFARRLQTRLQHLGATPGADQDDDTEQSWLTTQTHYPTILQPPLSSSSESDVFFDFDVDLLESPGSGSPPEETTEEIHLNKHDTLSCCVGETGCVSSNLLVAQSPSSDSSDGNYYDPEPLECPSTLTPLTEECEEVVKCTGHVVSKVNDEGRESKGAKVLNAVESQNGYSEENTSRNEKNTNETLNEIVDIKNCLGSSHEKNEETICNGQDSDDQAESTTGGDLEGGGGDVGEESNERFCSTFELTNARVVECPGMGLLFSRQGDLIGEELTLTLEEKEEGGGRCEVTCQVGENTRDENGEGGETREGLVGKDGGGHEERIGEEESVCESQKEDTGQGGGEPQNGEIDEVINEEGVIIKEAVIYNGTEKSRADVQQPCDVMRPIPMICVEGVCRGDICDCDATADGISTEKKTDNGKTNGTTKVGTKKKKDGICKTEEEQLQQLIKKCEERTKHSGVSDDEVDDDDDRPRRVQRCSSLKTGKTPPGTPGRKKIVRFADVLGLDLADVRTFLDEVPKIPISAYEDLPNADLSLGNSTSNSQNTTQLPICHLPNPERSLVPLFQQPGGCPDFMDRVRNQYVCLENAMVKEMATCTIVGTVRVLNLDFFKSVHIRYTLDGWATFSDLQTTYVVNSCDGFSDTFSFVLYGNLLTVGQRLEFAVRFQCHGNQYWDSNHGMNYAFQCLPPPGPAPHLSLACEGDRWGSFY